MVNNPLNFDMTRGSLFGRIMILVLPLTWICMQNYFLKLADPFIVGRYAGSGALATIGSTFAITDLIKILITGIACGVLVVAAQCRGAGDDRALNRTVSTSLVLALLCGIVLMSTGLIFARQLLIFMRVPNDLIAPSTSYLRLSFLSIPFTVVFTVCIMLMYGLGDTLWPLLILFVSGIVKGKLNAVFVKDFNLGVTGVALATLISQIIAAMLALLIMTVFKGPEQIIWKKIKIHAREFGLIAKVCIPIMLMGIAIVLSKWISSAAINAIGVSAAAGNIVAAQHEGLAQNIFVLPMYYMAMVFVGQNCGTEKYNRVLKGMLICVLLLTVALAIPVSIGLIFGERLVGFITTDQEVVEQAMIRLSLTLPAYFLLGIAYITTGALIGLGRWWAAVASGVTVLGICAFRIIWVNTIFKLPEFHSLRGLLISHPVSWGIVALANGAIFFIVIGCLMRKQHHNPTAF